MPSPAAPLSPVIREVFQDFLLERRGDPHPANDSLVTLLVEMMKEGALVPPPAQLCALVEAVAKQRHSAISVVPELQPLCDAVLEAGRAGDIAKLEALEKLLDTF